MHEPPRVQVGMATDPGTTRARNEDFAACLTAEPSRMRVVAALADGVGGAKRGRVAAETAVRLFLDAIEELNPLRGIETNAATALEAINRWLHTQGQADTDLSGMARAFAALIATGRQIHAVHIGDSRLQPRATAR